MAKVEQSFRITPWDFVDPSSPWVLRKGKSPFERIFVLIPDHYRYGPWHLGPCLLLAVLAYLAILGATWMNIHPPQQANTWLDLFRIDNYKYEAFSSDWYQILTISVWMLYICYDVSVSGLGAFAWTTFTVWSWTIVTIRSFLLVLAPWFPSVRLFAEFLRFPGLLSASLTTAIWNLILFPAIGFVYIRKADQRKNFFKFFTNFRLMQLHLFNLLYAYGACAHLSPKRPLHLGDLAASMIMVILYMLFYYSILDRLAVHFYPIFSPRTPIQMGALAITVVCIWANFTFWQSKLRGEET